MMTVTHDGQVYEEMHVDGGTLAQSFLYPPNFSLERLSKQKGINRKRVAYIIRNGRLFRDEAEIPRQTLSVAAQAASTMNRSKRVERRIPDLSNDAAGRV